MHQSTHNTQVFSMFGGGYVLERGGTDEMPGNLAPSDIDEAVTSLTIDVQRGVAITDVGTVC